MEILALFSFLVLGKFNFCFLELAYQISVKTQHLIPPTSNLLLAFLEKLAIKIFRLRFSLCCKNSLQFFFQYEGTFLINHTSDKFIAVGYFNSSRTFKTN